MTATHEGGADTVTITREAWDFLSGVGELEGYWFGEFNKTTAGAFWWRSTIREKHMVENPSAAIKAELAKAKADLGEIADSLLSHCSLFAVPLDSPMRRAMEIADPYRIEADPLVEAWRACWPEDTDVSDSAGKLRAELAKRGVTLP